MSVPQISAVVETWREEYRSLGLRESIRYVQIFENKGELMGCSNPHPHGQIWAEKTVPVEPAKEDTQQTTYLQSHGRCLLCDYLALELARGERVVCENPEFVAVVPFWAVWPFETLVLSRTHHVSIDTLETFECRSFAEILKRVSTRYDNLFNISFPYSCGIHQSPTDDDPHPGWHLHVHFYPPLLRSATVRKFMVGYEMLANPQRDITPELSAARLRELSETHFRSPAVAQSR
jgi:UDPglucose--hexose-1-phosphate uridylyltransferase